ncbi:acyl-[ACP]--phospholipid O-acyltransferase [Chenggangzhangella methanolivorans]|uniref:Acyl-[ACP]--phospholipid O-acyltransferase n=1 Tax=Chenggangzhangella methanolivorans TaxID=1437009 RepID=A0A9E6RB53_9HYPH|nr:acyl-[ACP]--phospholipid O-acyltransferase [Chenggangzhangella methanolivorans]QZO01538.1 acyl-[ACP]--phospholipid O-acyltransferase [Chenggangzhangella methanolivorans]
MMFSLLRARRFAPLFGCQFFAAFNDNFVKNALAILLLYKIGGDHGPLLVTLAGALFIAPYFILSALGGELADRYDKARMAKLFKLGEIGVAVIAAVGFIIPSAWLLFAALILTGILSALFGPVKYGILPDHLARNELVAGNALVETATFLAILAGTVGGGIMVAEASPWVVAATTIAVSVIAWAFAALIPPTGERAPDLHVDRNVARSTWALLKDLKRQPRLWIAAIAVSAFWLTGAIVLALLPTLVKQVIGGSESVVTLFLAAFTVGIAAGSLLAAKLSKQRILLALTPIAGIITGLFAIDLAIATWHMTPAEPLVGWRDFLRSWTDVRVALDMVGLAAAGGLFVVPIFAFLQAEAGEDRRARVIAANNVLNAAFMVGGSVLLLALQAAGLSTQTLFLLVGVLSIVGAPLLGLALPGSMLRDSASLILSLVYRVEVRGMENLTDAGPKAVVAVNHTSLLDAPLVMSLLADEPVFAVNSQIAERWWVKPFLKLVRAFPMDPTKPLATRALIKLVKEGNRLVIFPEGRISVTGSLMKVYDGAGLIADKSEAPVVPVRIEGLDRSPFSYLKAGQIRKHLFPKVTVTILPARRLEVDQSLVGRKRRQAAGMALTDVMSDMHFQTTDTAKTVHQAVVDAARAEGFDRVAVEDALGVKLTYRRLLAGAAALGARIDGFTAPGEKVAVLLPNTAGVVLAILALHRSGRVPAMLNYTAGAANLVSACKAAEVKTVLTSRAFIEKGRLQKEETALGQACRLVYLEDVREQIGGLDRIKALMASGTRSKGDPEAPAAVLFTSGSEGAPKGVVLTHRNLLSNVAQVAARIDFGPSDVVFNVLPVFHAFGLTGGLLLPLVSAVKTFMYPSPLHYRIVPELVYGTNATVLFGTDTFLQGYARTAHPYDFRSLRFVVAGAEAVKPETRKTYSEKFGLRILEGYGITEASPVVAVNTPTFNRSGTVGRLLPAIESRLEAVDGVTEGGRLHIRGPNIMAGYLKADQPGVLQPPAEGWHDTGDIVAIDEQGFVAIKGRAKRFAKIAGEMVSLGAVEGVVQKRWPEAASAATTAPDPRKGERVVLVTTDGSIDRPGLRAAFRAAGMPDLSVPAEIVVVEKIPLLGSGKTDYVGLKELAAKTAGGSKVDEPQPEEPEAAE